MSSNPVGNAAQSVSKANKKVLSDGMVVQTYCITINAAANFNFDKIASLKELQTELNEQLKQAKVHATQYLNSTQKLLINNLGNIQTYYQEHKAIADVMPKDSTVEQWTEALGSLMTKANNFKTEATNAKESLADVLENINSDLKGFNGYVVELNTKLNGDNGTLTKLKVSLKSVESSIAGLKGALASSLLGFIGGIAIICVGSAAEFETEGTSTSVVLFGSGVLATSVGGTIVSGVELEAKQEEKQKILEEEKSLNAQVKVLTGINTQIDTMVSKLNDAINAMQTMESSWDDVANVLTNISSDLKSSVINTGAARKVFIDDANSDITNLLKEVSEIEKQMASVKVVKAKENQTLVELMREEANKY